MPALDKNIKYLLLNNSNILSPCLTSKLMLFRYYVDIIFISRLQKCHGNSLLCLPSNVSGLSWKSMPDRQWEKKEEPWVSVDLPPTFHHLFDSPLAISKYDTSY
jgi:hypothetical protein